MPGMRQAYLHGSRIGNAFSVNPSSENFGSLAPELFEPLSVPQGRLGCQLLRQSLHEFCDALLAMRMYFKHSSRPTASRDEVCKWVSPGLFSPARSHFCAP